MAEKKATKKTLAKGEPKAPVTEKPEAQEGELGSEQLDKVSGGGSWNSRLQQLNQQTNNNT